ncbi:MAG: DoxX family protein [Candidatus Rokubacteria bacterium]|nr:DoxX family protein [Candidatus Rokubacteria bacterium]
MNDWGLALLRVTLGLIFVMHGYSTWAGPGPGETAGVVTAIGYPAALSTALAWYLILAHLGGGVLMILGIWARMAALLNVPIMASAVFLVHWQQGFFLRGVIVDAAAGRAFAGGYEFALLVLAVTLVVALLGPGSLSLEAVRARRVIEVP